MSSLAERLLRPTRGRLVEALGALVDASPSELRGLLAKTPFVELTHSALAFALRDGAPDGSGWVRVPVSCGDPAEAWERLAARGVIPDAWVDDARRAFEAPVGTHHGLLARRVAWAPMALSHPPTLGGCVAFASDPQGVLTAEAVVRELCARRPAMAERAGERALWRTLDARAAARKRALYERTVDRVPPPWPELTRVVEAGYLFLNAGQGAALLAAAEWG